jgi:hypothetical protein
VLPILLPYSEDRHDIPMVEARRRFGLALEAAQLT